MQPLAFLVCVDLVLDALCALEYSRFVDTGLWDLNVASDECVP